ncbi:MAG: S53 family peptidase [Rhizomicrobium sp.]
MRNRAGLSLLFPVLMAACLLAVAPPAGAQLPGQQIVTAIDESHRVTLAGNTRPEARAKKNDRGAVPDSLAMTHMQLLLRRSPVEERSITQLIDQLHDRNSANYHRWLSPSEFGEEFGVGIADIQTISGWLARHGFQVNAVYANRMMIDFSGTAAQVRDAFKTQIHYLNVNGVRHVANISDPQIPAALAPAIVGVVSLHDFRPNKLYRARPQYTFTQGNFTYQAVVPADLATIYNFNPLFTSGITGKGETIVVIEDSDVFSTSDWTTFRSTFNLSTYTSGSLTTVHPNTATSHGNCVDPGINSDDGEAILDAEWSSAAAPNAAIKVASCADTDTTFGGLIALQNILNLPSPPQIVSISYGECEAYNGAAANAAYYATYQQAVAEGISVFVAAGDDNAAGCDSGQWVSFQGISVNGFASTPYNVAVGGTDFGDSYAKNNSTYWSSTNAAAYGSALSYVPEIPWNDSCASTLVSKFLTGSTVTYGTTGFCNSATGQQLWQVDGGSGGPSGCAYGATSQQSAAAVSGTCSGYAKPSWQKLVGNPSDNARDIPDVSLFAADGLWGHYYVICYSDVWGGGAPCTGAPSGWTGAGGTSFASPIMAGIQALVDQKMKSRQGNPNPVLYSLAATEYGASGNASCNSTLGKTVKSTCIFYDVTLGDNDVNCTSAQMLGLTNYGLTYLGPVNCYIPSAAMGVLSTSNTAYKPAYAATTGWDFATGIGSINAANLVKAWP